VNSPGRCSPCSSPGSTPGRVIFQREDIITGDIRRREKREAKALREHEKRALPPADQPDNDS